MLVAREDKGDVASDCDADAAANEDDGADALRCGCDGDENDEAEDGGCPFEAHIVSVCNYDLLFVIA